MQVCEADIFIFESLHNYFILLFYLQRILPVNRKKGALNKSEHPCSSQISLHFQHPLMTKSQVLCFFIKAFLLYDSSVAFICQPHGFIFYHSSPSGLLTYWNPADHASPVITPFWLEEQCTTSRLPLSLTPTTMPTWLSSPALAG